MSNQEISKRKIGLFEMGGAVVLFLVLLFCSPFGFIFGEMVVWILYGANPTASWVVFAAIMVPLLWWLWGPRKHTI